MKSRKQRRPTIHQTSWLRRIAQYGLMVTRTPGEKDRYSLTNGDQIPHNTAKCLILNGWVKPQRDGLFGDETQTYRVLTP